MTKKAESLTTRVTDVLRTKGLAVDSAVTFGDPASQIVNEAQQWAADLIVLGADSYRSGRKETHSVAQSIVDHAPCRVEVVEQGKAAFERRITGITGLIGTKLAEAFVSQYTVVGLDVKPSEQGTANVIECDLT
jgi:universal stress protein family protein